MLTLTESAQKAIGRFVADAETSIEGLRISVTGGGCSGMQSGMAVEEAAVSDDLVPEIGALRIFIEPTSAPELEEVTVDVVGSADGSGFEFENPHATVGCGRGKSFST